MSEPEIIKAPFTSDQVTALNMFQNLGFVHPFTCGEDSNHGALVATVWACGWICPYCDYTQDWAHAQMASDDFKWMADAIARIKTQHGPVG